MKMQVTCILLIAGMALCAGCAGSGEPPEAAPDAFYLLGSMYADVLEGIEEAFGYVLINDSVEKDDFWKKMNDFDTLASEFSTEAELGAPQHAEWKAQYDAILASKLELTEKAGAMFAAFEKTGTVSPAEVGAFEDAVDDLTGKLDEFSAEYLAAVDPSAFEGYAHRQAATELLVMHSDILEAVEEAFGYVLIGDVEEKDDFLKKMNDFDALVVAFRSNTALVSPGHADPTQQLDEVIAAKAELETAALAMFAAYEVTGQVPSDDLFAFEAAVDDFTVAYDLLVNRVMGWV